MKRAVFLAVSLLTMGVVLASGVSGDGKEPGVAMPVKYAQMKNRLWDDPGAIAAGEVIYREKCAVCHGEKGNGRGPAAVVSPVKPADFTNKNMVATMRDGYWFWRVTEGGAFPPFNSIMPAFGGVLTEEQIWQVISYEHTFSHKGLHAHEELQKARPHGHHEHGDHDEG